MTNTNEQIRKISKKDLVGILQNHRLDVLRDSPKKFEETSKRIDAYWNDLEYDTYKITGTCLISQLRISNHNLQVEDALFSNKPVEMAVSLYNENEGNYHLSEYARGENPERAYTNLIDRLQK